MAKVVACPIFAHKKSPPTEVMLLYHIFYKMKMTRREVMEHYLSIVRDCLEIGVRPRCHLEDITRADFYG